MVNRDNPYLASRTRPYKNVEAHVSIYETPVILINMVGYKEDPDIPSREWPYQKVPIDYESKKYVHVHAKHITYTYDADGNEQQNEKIYQVEKCS